jgi:glycerol uptake facilitator-like aquaporin
LFIAGRTSLIKTLCYTLSQMLGSVWGALMLWHIFGSNWPAARAFGSNSYDPIVFTASQVFFAEMLGTMLLMFNVLSTIDIPKPFVTNNYISNYTVDHYFPGAISGASNTTHVWPNAGWQTIRPGLSTNKIVSLSGINNTAVISIIGL